MNIFTKIEDKINGIRGFISDLEKIDFENDYISNFYKSEIIRLKIQLGDFEEIIEAIKNGRIS